LTALGSITFRRMTATSLLPRSAPNLYQVLHWHMVSLASSLDAMGNETFWCPQCQRELPYAHDTYNPETQTCRACGRGETPSVQEAQANVKSVSEVVATDAEITRGHVGRARWTQPAQDEVPPPKVS
jgi:hypothetical protein